ncbi:MAG: RNA-binding domain-containing protein [Candidatus Hadarchaeales archaeon]
MANIDDYDAIFVRLETFCHATEDENKVMNAMQLLLPEGVDIVKKRVEGYHKNPIIIFSAEARGRKIAKSWFDDIIRKLDERGLETVARKIEAMDRSNTIYLRFDKQKACLGRLTLLDADDVLHVKVRLVKKHRP